VPGAASRGSYAASGGSAGAARLARLSALPAHERRMARRAQHRHGLKEYRLRVEVRKLSGCMGALPTLGRRVLTLRAGLGGRTPRSRSRVARRLDISRARVTRIERRSLKRLRSANASTGCGSGGSSRGAVAVGRGPASGSPFTPFAQLHSAAPARGAVLGASAHSSGGERRATVPTKLRSTGARLASTLDDQSARTGFALAILAALIAGVMIGAGTRFRRRPAPARAESSVYPRWYVDPFERPPTADDEPPKPQQD
jgi:hypothetical protein